MEHLGKVMFALVSCEADRFDVATQLLELPHRLQFKFNDMRGGQVVAILKMLQNRFLFTKSLWGNRQIDDFSYFLFTFALIDDLGLSQFAETPKYH